MITSIPFNKQLIRQGVISSKSIDRFLHDHRSDNEIVSIGKIAIARAILKFENLFVNNFNKNGLLVPDPQKLESTWINLFIQHAFNDCTWRELPKRLERISFIVFNYDRCLEHLLLCGLMNKYGESEQEVASILKDLNVYHPYGTVGKLPWQASDQDNQSEIKFGADVDWLTLSKAAEQIRIFTEQKNDSDPMWNAIAHVVNEASLLMFLGFGFDSLNMQILAPSTSKSNNEYCLGTRKGISDFDYSQARLRIDKFLSPISKCEFRDLECNQLIFEFSSIFERLNETQKNPHLTI